MQHVKFVNWRIVQVIKGEYLPNFQKDLKDLKNVEFPFKFFDKMVNKRAFLKLFFLHWKSSLISP